MNSDYFFFNEVFVRPGNITKDELYECIVAWHNIFFPNSSGETLILAIDYYLNGKYYSYDRMVVFQRDDDVFEFEFEPMPCTSFIIRHICDIEDVIFPDHNEIKRWE